MISLPLDEEQKKTYDELNKAIHDMEGLLLGKTDPDDISAMMEELSVHKSYLGQVSIMMSQALAIFNHMKGKVAEEAMLNESVMNAKHEFQKRWMEGKLAKWDALYMRTEQVTKRLVNSIDALRTMISMQKSMLEKHI